MKYEGDFLNGKFNGKGKEFYSNGILLFEEEYLNGKKWNGIFYDRKHKYTFILKEGKGHIKEYDIYNGELKYEGDYVNGERDGKGKEYSCEHIMKFEGEYLNGKRNGKGKEYDYLGKLLFEGEYLDGEKNGNGKQYKENGKLLFQGEFMNGKRWNGIIFNKKIIIAHLSWRMEKNILKNMTQKIY